MSITYKKISELQPVTNILASDLFLISRSSTTELGYTTYNTTWQSISADLVSKASTTAGTLHLITDINNLSLSTANTSAVAGNVANLILTKTTTISSNYVDRRATGSYNISGVVTFTNTTPPKIHTATVDTSHLDSAVNVKALSTYCNTLIGSLPMPLFSTAILNLKIDRTIGLDALVPFAYSSSTKFTVVVKFNYTVSSTTKRLVLCNIKNGETIISPTTTAGNSALLVKNNSDPSKAINNKYYYVLTQITLSGTTKLSNITLEINNAASSVDVSIAIYNGHLASSLGFSG